MLQLQRFSVPAKMGSVVSSTDVQLLRLFAWQTLGPMFETQQLYKDFQAHE